MENTSLPWNDATTSLSEDDVQTLYLAYIRQLVLKIIYVVIGTVGVLDNLFVVIVFALFIRISDKVLTLLQYVSTIRTSLSFTNNDSGMVNIGINRFYFILFYGFYTCISRKLPINSVVQTPELKNI